jgi:hypothetical protein
MLGIGPLEYMALFVRLAPLLAYPVLAVLALLSLRGRHLSNPTQAIWVLIVVAVPFLGPLAYWIMRPTREPGGAGLRP